MNNVNDVSCQRFLRRAGLAFAIVLALTACGDQQGEPVRGDRAPVVTAATPYAFSMKYRKRSNQEIADRAQILSNVVISEAAVVASDLAALVAAAAAQPGPKGRIHVAVANHPGLVVGYSPERDEAWAWNESLMNDYTTATDVGLAAATAVFRASLKQLLDAGGTDPRGLDASSPEVRYIMQATGRTDQSARTEAIKEYSFFVPRTLNGLVVRHAGVRISVHRSGKVTLVNVSGPTIDSTMSGTAEVPAAAGATPVQVSVQQASIDARVAQEQPGATIRSLGLTYRLPEGAGRAANVVPMQTYAVSSNTTAPDGRTIHGRIHYLYYSVEDANAPPIEWPTPAPDATGDPRP